MTAILDAFDLLSLKSGATITTRDQWASLVTDGGAVAQETIYQHKNITAEGAAAATGVIGCPITLWEYEGTPQSHGAVPGAFSNPTNATVGGLLQANPGGVRNKWLLSLIASSQAAGLLILYDRLLQMGGLSGTVTSAQNINGGSAATLTRYGTSTRNLLWAEIYTAVGGTATTLTASYTNQAGTAGQTTQPVVFGGAGRQEAQRLIQLSLAAGDTGVRAITSVTLAGTTGTAGSFGVVIAHPLMAIPLATAGSTAIARSWFNAPLPQILTNACLALAFIPTAALAPVVDLVINSVEV